MSGSELGFTALVEAGLVCLDPRSVVDDRTVFRPADRQGVERPITVGPYAEIGAYAVIHGGTEIGARARVEDHTIIGQPELGYAVRRHALGAGLPTRLYEDVVVRAGAILYAGVTLGARSAVGHHSVLRTLVSVGADTLLGHFLSIERGSVIGSRVRCSPGSHITSETVIEDDVFLGAGVRTINDNGLDWQVGGGQAPLTPPRFDAGCKVGSNATILGGVRIGAGATVGAGSVVTRDVAPATLVYGNPARPARRATGGAS